MCCCVFRWLVVVVVLGGGMGGAMAAAEKAAAPPLDRELAAALRRADAAAAARLLSADPGQIAARDERGWTPLMHAGFYADEDCVRRLVERGADVKATNKAGATALHYAASDLAKVKVLAEHGADVNAASAIGNTPLMLAARSSGSSPVVRLLLEKGANVNARNAYVVDALMLAASADDVDAVRLLVEHGADVLASPPMQPVDSEGHPLDPILGGGQTALSWAARRGNLEMVRLLLDAGADVNGPMLLGSPLVAAAQMNHPDVARLLLDHGADLEANGPMASWTPLMWSAANEHGDAELVKLLLEKGANVNARRGDRWGPFMAAPPSPLMIALRRGDTSIAAALRGAGAADAKDPWAAKLPRPPERLTTAADVDPRILLAAIATATPLLQRTAIESQEEFAAHHQDCISCHNQILPLMAINQLRAKGIPYDEPGRVEMVEMLRRDARAFEAYSSEPTMHPSPASFAGYFFWALSADTLEPDLPLDATAHTTAVNQSSDGGWTQFVPRPPMTEAEISSTALGVRALTLHPLPGRQDEMRGRVGRARDWLRNSAPRITEEHVYKLLGLHWAGEPPEELSPLVDELTRLQRADGGWAQLPNLQSDAYATGQALYALREAGGLAASEGTIRKGLAYLVRTQMEDGSWYVRRRAYPFQPTMDPKFPHGRDAWISTAATSWAVMALSAALEKQDVENVLATTEIGGSAVALAATARLPKAAERAVDFDADVLPILENSCLTCHTSGAAAGQYALDARESLIKGGFSGPPVVIPGNSADSPLIHHVAGLIEDVEMPPPARRDEFEPLTEEQVGILRAWIDQGLPGLAE